MLKLAREQYAQGSRPVAGIKIRAQQICIFCPPPPPGPAAPSVVQRRLSSGVTVSMRMLSGTSSARLRRSSGAMGSLARNAR